MIKAPGLLPMLYTPREIAEDLDIPETTLRDWLNHGAPHSRDESNHIWINGKQFADWVDNQRNARKKPSHQLKRGRAFVCAAMTSSKSKMGKFALSKATLVI